MQNPWLYFWNPLTWSLTAEAIFYISFPFVITLLNKIKRESFLLETAMALYGFLCLATVGAFLIIMNMPFDLFPLWYTSTLKPGTEAITEAEVRNYCLSYFIYLLPFLRCFEFWIGCSIGCFFDKLRRKDGLPKEGIRNCLLASSILLISIGYQVKGAMGIGFYAVYIPGFTLFIFSLASGKTFASGLLSHKWIVILGKSSYALYISHYASMAINQNLANIKGIVFPQGSYFIAVGLCLAISLIIYYLVEIPVQRWLIEIGKSRLTSS
jgi:peptidoglycan/LPS O-acetylase OafA/YrhL